MWTDDYHNHYVRPETMEELEELIAPLILYKKGVDRWENMYRNILNCVEVFGFMNISLYQNDYLKYGDGIEEFLHGFWLNLREADYNEGSVELENTTVTIEDGFMFVRQ